MGLLLSQKPLCYKFAKMYQNCEVCLLNKTELIHAACIMYVLTLCQELNTVDSPMFYFTYFFNT